MGSPNDITNKREQTKARNREMLLAAAREVFVELGYDAATVRDIVARTNLAPGTFYNYFTDKRSVLVALMSEFSAEAGRRARAARTQPGTFKELVYRGFRAYFEFIASDPTMFALLRRNLSTLRSLGMEETGFDAQLQDLHSDLVEAMERGLMPRVSLRYLPLSIGAIAFEIGAYMVASDPPDVEGASQFAAEFCAGGIERLTGVEKPSRKTKRAGPRDRRHE